MVMSLYGSNALPLRASFVGGNVKQALFVFAGVPGWRVQLFYTTPL
jgi:hypothetical protein